MRVVTTDEMKKIDSWATNKLGIPGVVLMENAGRGCVNVLEEYFDLEQLKVLIVCGTGNNGGDGFVIARHLQNRNACVTVVILGAVRRLKGDARANYTLAKKSRIELHEVKNIGALKHVYRTFHPTVIVDALFGTGFRGTPQGIYRKAIDFVNDTDAFIFSVDIPSGINGDDGQFEQACVIADATATMCLPKRGNFLFPGREFCGDIYVVDIGVPYALTQGFPQITEFNDISTSLPCRPPDGNKGTFGTVLTVAGARGFTGAAALATRAALKVGAGLVRLASPAGIMDALESKLLEVVTIALPQTDAETINVKACDTLLPYLDKASVVVLGPGITTHPATAQFVSSFIPHVSAPLIIDADAINIIAQNSTILKKIQAPFVLTPHPGELSRLTRLSPQEINLQRIDLAKKLAQQYGGVLVLKGAPTVIASPQGEVYVNPTGNSGLASAGSGDVLVGMISGFVAQDLSLLTAATAAVFLHGLCAELAMDESNEYSLTAGDLLDIIPASINYVLRREFVEDESND